MFTLSRPSGEGTATFVTWVCECDLCSPLLTPAVDMLCLELLSSAESYRLKDYFCFDVLSNIS